MNLDYKLNLSDQLTENSSKSLMGNSGSELNTSETLQKIREIVEIFQQSHDLSLIQYNISQLKIIIDGSDQETLQILNYELKLNDIIAELLQLGSIQRKYKVEIVEILQSLLFNEISENNEEEEHESSIIEFMQTPACRTIFDLLFESDPHKVQIKSILKFLSNISLESSNTRNLLLENFPNADSIPPFVQLFNYIQCFDEIPELQQCYIDLIVHLCYYEMDDEMTQQIYEQVILPLFDYTKERDKLTMWDSLLCIIHYFALYHGALIGSNESTFDILDFSIQNGTQNAIDKSLTIYNIFVDSNIDIHTHIDYANICENILNHDEKISEAYLKLVEVLINPLHNISTQESGDFTQAGIAFHLDQLLKNGILMNLNEILENGIHNHKIISMRIIKYLSKIVNPDTIDSFIQSPLITNALELLESKDLSIARHIIKFVLSIMSKCNEDGKNWIVYNRMKEDNIDTLTEIVNETQDSEDEKLKKLGSNAECLIKIVEDILKANS